MNKIFATILLILMISGCSSSELDDFRGEGTIPVVALESVTLNGYILSAKGAITQSGASQLVEYGIYYNETKYGAPSPENKNSKIKFEKNGATNNLNLSAELMPEKEYSICFYAINAQGTGLSEVKTIKTGKLDINILLPGTYIVDKHQSYFYPTPYEEYEVKIKKENGKFFLYGLGSANFKINPDSLKLELKVNTVIQDKDTIHQVTIPLQLTKMNTTIGGIKYPILILSGTWLLDDNTDTQNVFGVMKVKDDVTVSIESGYAFVLCDPITHEIKLDATHPLVEFIVGPKSYPVPPNAETPDNYPRPSCNLIKKNQ